jgi:class 3 adenylate cyclase/nitrogen-specific signal transduction histidine kinase
MDDGDDAMTVTTGSELQYLDRLDAVIAAAAKDRRQRLATYVRRYMSPLLVAELFEQGKLGILMDEYQVSKVTVMIADVRGFTPQTLDYEIRGQGLRKVADLLEKFFDDALETVFEYRGIMGEFSGDRFMAVFGMPYERNDDADRAMMAATEIYDNALRLNRHLRMTRQHHLTFDIGIGMSTGGPVWIGDIGSGWRRELTMIGTIINAASRVEELTKSEEFSNEAGYNIILTEATVDSLSPLLRSHLGLKDFSPRQLRSLGDTQYRLFKLLTCDTAGLPALRERIDTATQAVVDAVAEVIESIQEREDALRLSLTMQDIGQAISSSLQLEDILQSVMDGIQRFLHATTASLLLIEEGSNRLRFKAVRPRENLPILQAFEENLVVGTGIVGYVAATGESLCLGDAQADSRFYSRADAKTGMQTRSVLCTPILLEGRIIGVIQVIDNQIGKFGPDDLQVLQAIAGFTTSAIRNARQHREVAEAEMVASMSLVTSMIAHKLKGDAGLIQVISQRLLDKLAEADTALERSFLERKLKEINERAAQLLAAMNEIRHPFSELKLEKINLRDMLESVLEASLAKAEQKEAISIRRSYQAVPSLITDKARLSNVFFNVVENAIRAMKDSSRKELTLELWQPEPSCVRIGIADTGPGIPSDRKRLLFRPIQPTEKRGAAEGGGWGYGLWSSHLSIRSLGGTISLDEVHSDGTRMIIDLPLNPPSGEESN